MDVKVRLTGVVRHIVKEGEVRLALPEEATVRDLLKTLIDRYGEKFKERVLSRGDELSRSVKVFIDNEAIEGLDQRLNAETPGTPEVTVMVLSAVSGG